MRRCGLSNGKNCDPAERDARSAQPPSFRTGGNYAETRERTERSDPFETKTSRMIYLWNEAERATEFRLRFASADREALLLREAFGEAA